jgi:pseudoazurin
MKLHLLVPLFLASTLLVACGEDSKQEDGAETKVEAPAITEKVEAPVVTKKEEPKVEIEKVVEEKKIVAEASKPSGSSDDAATGTVHEIKMKNSNADGIMVFEPGFLKINKGDTVNFVEVDAGHNAVSEVSPGGPWQVGFSGGKVKFDVEGVNIYYCVPHRSMAMYGVIQVGEAKNKDDALAKAKTIDAGFAMNTGRLIKYIEQVK